MGVCSRGYLPHCIQPFKKTLLRPLDNQQVNVTVNIRLPVSVGAEEDDLLRRVPGNQSLDDFLNHSPSLVVPVHEIVTSNPRYPPSNFNDYSLMEVHAPARLRQRIAEPRGCPRVPGQGRL